MNGAAATEFQPRRMALALTLGVLVIASAPAFAASAEEPGFSVLASIEDAPERDWYVTGDSLSVSISIANLGEATSLTSNPSCPAVLSAYSESGQLLWDGLEDAGCRQQSRGTDFGTEEIIEWFDLTWNFSNSSGESVPSGLLTIVVDIPSTNLSTEFEVLWQAPVGFDPALNFELITAETPSGTYTSAEAMFAAISIHNTANEEVTISSAENCRLRFSAWQNDSLLTDHLTDIPCDGGLGGEVFDIAELRHYEWKRWNFLGDSGNEVETGEVLIEIGLPDRSLTASATVNYTNLGTPENSLLSGQDSPLAPSVILSKSADSDGVIRTSSGESLGFTGILTNLGNETVTASFDNICRIEIFIINPDGEIVYDTRDGRDCVDIDIDHIIETDSFFSIEHADWPLVDRNGCGLVFGTYTVVVDVPEFRLRTTTEFVHSDDGSGIACMASIAESSTSTMQLSEPVVGSDGDENLSINIALFNGDSSVDMRWLSPCRLSVEIVDPSTMLPVGWAQTWCGVQHGERLRISPGSEVFNEQFSLFMVSGDSTPLVDGDYILKFRINAMPSVELQYEISWPLEDGAVNSDGAVNQSETAEDILDVIPTAISGSWMYLTTETGGCWVLNAGDESHLLLDATSVAPWTPKPRTMGTYYVLEDSSFAPDCQGWDNHIAVVEVLFEQALPTESENSGTAEVESEVQQESIIETAAPTVITVVVSTSILSMLVVTITSNESLRITISQLGLAIIGLVGRTHETSDGKYQRGRLMGYLTANPGCHFRALMAALDMSNGQITHHLKVLEEEGVVWRSKDGRLMRFYPATINRDTSPDELPIPALTPDPNSLQGKILRMLDHDGLMGKYPTQRDLADRLERSQQLISHHLRTLQKYGLIEKSRSGLKNRYKLTKEAVFLLDQPRL